MVETPGIKARTRDAADFLSLLEDKTQNFLNHNPQLMQDSTICESFEQVLEAMREYSEEYSQVGFCKTLIGDDEVIIFLHTGLIDKVKAKQRRLDLFFKFTTSLLFLNMLHGQKQSQESLEIRLALQEQREMMMKLCKGLLPSSQPPPTVKQDWDVLSMKSLDLAKRVDVKRGFHSHRPSKPHPHPQPQPHPRPHQPRCRDQYEDKNKRNTINFPTTTEKKISANDIRFNSERVKKKKSLNSSTLSEISANMRDQLDENQRKLQRLHLAYISTKK